MTKSKGPSTSPKVSGPIESSAAAKQPSPAAHHNGELPGFTALRAQLTGLGRGNGAVAARTLAVIPRAPWAEAIVVGPCGQPHRHHVGLDEVAPIIRKDPCGPASTSYVLDLDGAR